MEKFKFHRLAEMSIFVVTVTINEHIEFRFLLDTGATHSILDFNAIVFSGCEIQNLNYHSFIETANGVVSSDMVSISSFETLGIIKNDYAIQVIDFVSQGITTDYDGILGLDFLEGYHFCIDTLKEEITIQE